MMDQKPSLTTQLLFATIASLGGFILGTIVGWSSPAHDAVVKKLSITKEEYSWIASIMPLGGAFSQLLTVGLLMITGRKYVILILALLTLVQWIMLFVANDYIFYIASRFLLGLFAGGFCVVVPLFIGEITHKSVRGSLGVFFQLLLVLGIFYSYTFCYVNNLFLFNATCGMFPILLAVLIVFSRESPVYQYKRDKITDASKSLQYYRGKNYNIDGELAEIGNLTKSDGTTFWQSFKQKSSIKAAVMLLVLSVIQQLSGINVIMFYAHTIFKMSETNVDSKLSAIILGAVQILATAVAAVSIDKIGRKILWYISLSIMSICLFSLGFYFTCYKNDEKLAADLGVLPTVAIGVYICGYSIGCGPLPWVMIGEVLPTKMKSVVGTAVAFVNWILAFIITVSFPILVKLIGPDWVFYIYGIFTSVGVVFIIFCVYETKNKSLDEIQNMLQGNG